MRSIALAFVFLAGALASASAQPERGGDMTFRRVEAPNLCSGCDVVQATGLIGRDTPDAFADFLRREKIGRAPLYVVIDSDGGQVLAGWTLGRRLRALSAHMIAARIVERPDGAIALRPGACISMCNSLFAAGLERRISPGTLFGVHQFSPTTDAFSNLDNAVTVRDMRSHLKMVADWLAYAREMKIDQRLVEAQLNVPFEKVDFIPHATLAEWGVVTAPGSTLPRFLRNPRPGAEIIASQPMTGSLPLQSARFDAGAEPADRRWSPARQTGEWRETVMESDADFLKVTIACAPNGRFGMQIVLRGAPEARQTAMAQQIIGGGGFDLLDRPVDIAQISMGFGASFWIRAALRPDHVARLIARRDEFRFTLPPRRGEKRETTQIRTTGFLEEAAPMLAGCAASPRGARSATRG
ncbi:MAG: hypothetical protein J0H41_04340 [Rhizobiales bacterium]|nr:hypothetical protein [Hyphomicrobiales bacterium]